MQQSDDNNNKGCNFTLVYVGAGGQHVDRQYVIGDKALEMLKGKNKEELLTFIKEQLQQREPYYSKAQYCVNVDLMENYEKIKITIQKIRDLLSI